MKIVLNRDKFVNALTIGSMFAGDKVVMPVLENVKIKVRTDFLSVVSSDSMNCISRKMTDGVETDGEMSFCIRPTEVLAYIKSLRSEPVELRVDGGEAEIWREEGSFKIPVFPDSDFPVRKTDSDAIKIQLGASCVREWVSKGRNFVAKAQLRPVLNGILLYKKGNEMGVCATDGCQLYTDSMEDLSGCGDFAVIIDVVCFKPIIDAFADAESVEMSVGESSVMLKSANTSLLCALVEGRYPNFKSVIGTVDGKVKVYADRKELTAALKRCQLGASISDYVILTVENGRIVLNSVDMDFNKSVTESMDAETEVWGDFSIAFKIQNVLNVLGNMESEQVFLCMNSKTKPCFIREWPDPTNKLFLIMPMDVEK